MASIFQSKVIKEFKENGFEVLNVIKVSKSGFPDLIALKNGNSIFIECKEKTDNLKPLQKFRIDELIKNGFGAVCLQAENGLIYGESKKYCEIIRNIK